MKNNKNNEQLAQLAQYSTELVEKLGIKYYWEIDGYKLCNKQLSNWYEDEHSCYTTFVSQQYSSIKQNLSDKIIDLNHNYNLEYLQKIRAQYDYVQLFFSGGSDSLTVIDEAVNNQVYIDEIICLVIENIELPCNREIKENALPYLKKHKNSYGKYTIQNTSFDMLNELYSDPYAHFKTASAAKAPMPLGRPFLSAESRPVIPNSCYIKCSDKPTILHYKGNWYTTFIDAAWGGSNAISNLLYFWLEGDNIKSYIKDAIKYRNYIKSNYIIGKEIKFFKADSLDFANSIIRTNPVNMNNQFKKILDNTNQIEEKYATRIVDAINAKRYDLLKNYFACLEQYCKIFPEFRKSKNDNRGKFAWFINIDTLEVCTQQELIPQGFQ